jgi:hypothetical protein
VNFIFDTSLVLYLPLHELDGASIRSRDARGHVGTVTGARWGYQGRYFDGDDDIEVPHASSIDITSQITIETWIKPDDVTTVGSRHVLRKHGAYVLQQSRDDIYVYVVIGGAYKGGEATAVLTAGEWHHVAGTYDGENILTYINGELKRTVVQSGAIDSVAVPLYIGSQTGTTAYFLGSQGEVRIYNRALTITEVQQNYLATKWRYQ